MSELTRRDALAAVSLVFLSGCEGGSTPAPSPPPSPPPPPPPPPPPTPPQVGSFGSLGATTATTFATIGYSIRGAGTGWEFAPVASSLNLQPEFTLRFTPPQRLDMAVAGYGEAQLVAFQSQGNATDGTIYVQFSAPGGSVTLQRVAQWNRTASYMMAGYYVGGPDAGRPDPYLMIPFLYGIPTPANALQATGSGTYSLGTESTETLQANYAARTVSGQMTLYAGNGPQLFDVVNGTISADGTRLSGQLVAADGTAGTIDGIFMGPAGQELALRTAFASAISLYPSMIPAIRLP